MNRYRCFAMSVALSLAFGMAAPAAGDQTINFNDLTYPNSPYDPNLGPLPSPSTGSYNDGWDLNGGFTSGGASFTNSYTPDGIYSYWSGWSYSNVYDPTLTGTYPFNSDVLHQFAAVPGAAPGGSGNYGIEYGTGGVINLPSGTSPVSFEVTNTNYTYLSMTVGDQFATTPYSYADHSYLELFIYGWSGLNGTGNQIGQAVTFYLANYTSPDSLPVDVWTSVDLSSLAGAQSLTFDYASSDVNSSGYINTPTYFAMDDLVLSGASVPEPSSWVLCLSGVGLALLSSRIRNRHRKDPSRQAAACLGAIQGLQ